MDWESLFLSDLKGLPLKELYWPTDAAEDYLIYLKKCKTIETLHLPKGILNKSQLKQIPGTINILYY